MKQTENGCSHPIERFFFALVGGCVAWEIRNKVVVAMSVTWLDRVIRMRGVLSLVPSNVQPSALLWLPPSMTV